MRLFTWQHHWFPLRFNRWMCLASGIFVASCCGTQYAFAIFSPLLRDNLGYTQVQLNAVATAGNIGAYAGIPAGWLYDRRGPKDVLVASTALAIGGNIMVWAFVSKTIASTVVVMCLVYPLALNAQTGYDTAAIVTHVRNFPPEFRGFVIGLHKAFVGLSGSIFAEIYAGFFSSDSLGYLIAIPVVLGIFGSIGMLIMNVVSPQEVNQPVRMQGMLFGYLFTLVVIFYLGGISFIQAFVHISDDLHLILVVAMFVLMFVFFLYPAFGRNPPLVKWVKQAEEHQPIISKFSEPQGGDPLAVDMNITQALKTGEFWSLFYVLFTGVGTGLMIMANISQVLKALDAHHDVSKRGVLVSLIGVGSACGRLIWGAGSERYRQKIPRTAFLVLSQVLMTGVQAYFALSTSPGMLYGGSLLFGLTYGSYWAMCPVLVGDIFGLSSFGLIYNSLQPGCVLGSLTFATFIAGKMYDHRAAQQNNPGHSGDCYGTDCFKLPFWINTWACASGILAALILHRLFVRKSHRMWIN